MNLTAIDESHYSRADSYLENAFTVGALVLWALVIYYAFAQQMPRGKYGVVFLGAILNLFVISEVREELQERRWRHIPLLIVSALIMVYATSYLYLEYEALNQIRVGFANETDYRVAYMVTVAILYLTWKSYGKMFFAVVVSGILYGYFGAYAPGILRHGGFSIDRLMMILVTDFGGFYGFLNRLMAAWIALFLLYAGFLEAYGAFDLIQRFSAKVSQFTRSGIAQTAVIASTIIGSLNGSPTANAGMTGSFTIPMMIKNNVKPSNAAGIETVASTTGMVLPPVMGAAAFVMASILGIGYVRVIIAGLLPALIMVVSIAIAVHYTVVDDIQVDSTGSDFEFQLSNIEKVTEVLKFGIPFVILIWTLGILQYTVMTAALYTSTSMLATGIVFPIIGAYYESQTEDESQSVGMVTEQIKTSLSQTVFGFRRAAAITIPVAIVLASVNGFVDLLTTTGVPDILALGLISISGGILIIAAVLALGICVLLGMGMPATAAYTIVALLVAPTIISEFGVPDLAGHYFVFYSTILSGMIPPVAITALVASSIADASFWRTCLDAGKIAAPLFILPFTFLYHTEIVVGGITLQTLFISIIIMIGALSLIFGLNYNFSYKRIFTLPLRAGFIVSGVLIMVHPSLMIQAAAISLVLMLAIVNTWRRPEESSIYQALTS
jgi:TRAP transporter 4TM/12TM fusion protein